jgi:hypothetical protein
MLWQKFTGEGVAMSYASRMFHSNDGRDLIAMFSATGLFASMALVVLAGLQDVHRWF